MRRAFMLLALTATAPLAAQSGGAFRLEFSTIDGGGGRMTGGAFALTGAIAQPDAADDAPLSGGDFRLLPGFLVAGGDDDRLFANGFEDTP